MKSAARPILALALLALLLPAPADARRTRAAPAPDDIVFRFGMPARAALQALWHASIAAHEERVACIGGYRDGHAAYVTRVKMLEPSSADSIAVSALASLAECGPPAWFGTVHTHIVMYQGQPFSTFSPADRWTIGAWQRGWHEEGVFCVLYSETMSHCEAGADASADPAYAAVVGNRILP